MKQTDIAEYEVQARAGKGLKTFHFYKTKSSQNGSYIAGAHYTQKPCVYTVARSNGESELVSLTKIPSQPRFAKGEQLVMGILGNVVTGIEG